MRTIKMLVAKNIATSILVLIVAASAISCRDKAAEKRIAELEARLSQLEKDKPAAGPVATPVVDPNTATPAPETKPEGPLPVIKFERTEWDFGQIKEGEKVVY